MFVSESEVAKLLLDYGGCSTAKEGLTVTQEWKKEGDPRRTLSIASLRPEVRNARNLVYKDLRKRWVDDLSESFREFYLISSLLDPRTKALQFCNDENSGFPSSWKLEAHTLVVFHLKCFFAPDSKNILMRMIILVSPPLCQMAAL